MFHWKHDTARFGAKTSSDSKRIYINRIPDNCDLNIEIDHDDVDTEAVERDTIALLHLLDTHWPAK
jgi:hypothetical protein